jgi:hypothetical protein
MAPLLAIGWTLALALYYLGMPPAAGLLVILAVAMYGTLGNFAAFFEVAAAARLDGSRGRIRLLPFLIVGFLVSLVSVSIATVAQLGSRRKGELLWEKTERHRAGSATAAGGTP